MIHMIFEKKHIVCICMIFLIQIIIIDVSRYIYLEYMKNIFCGKENVYCDNKYISLSQSNYNIKWSDEIKDINGYEIAIVSNDINGQTNETYYTKSGKVISIIYNNKNEIVMHSQDENYPLDMFFIIPKISIFVLIIGAIIFSLRTGTWTSWGHYSYDTTPIEDLFFFYGIGGVIVSILAAVIRNIFQNL